MSMRELAVQATAMRNAGKSPAEIRKFVWRGMTALTMEDRTPMTEYDIAPDGWQMGRGTGEIITCGADGYHYVTTIGLTLDDNQAGLPTASSYRASWVWKRLRQVVVIHIRDGDWACGQLVRSIVDV